MSFLINFVIYIQTLLLFVSIYRNKTLNRIIDQNPNIFTVASQTSDRALIVFELSKAVGWTLLVSNTTISYLGRSAHIIVPVKPVWPNELGEK